MGSAPAPCSCPCTVSLCPALPCALAHCLPWESAPCWHHCPGVGGGGVGGVSRCRVQGRWPLRGSLVGGWQGNTAVLQLGLSTPPPPPPSPVLGSPPAGGGGCLSSLISSSCTSRIKKCETKSQHSQNHGRPSQHLDPTQSAGPARSTEPSAAACMEHNTAACAVHRVQHCTLRSAMHGAQHCSLHEVQSPALQPVQCTEPSTIACAVYRAQH